VAVPEEWISALWADFSHDERFVREAVVHWEVADAFERLPSRYEDAVHLALRGRADAGARPAPDRRDEVLARLRAVPFAPLDAVDAFDRVAAVAFDERGRFVAIDWGSVAESLEGRGEYSPAQLFAELCATAPDVMAQSDPDELARLVSAAVRRSMLMPYVRLAADDVVAARRLAVGLDAGARSGGEGGVMGAILVSNGLTALLDFAGQASDLLPGPKERGRVFAVITAAGVMAHREPKAAVERAFAEDAPRKRLTQRPLAWAARVGLAACAVLLPFSVLTAAVAAWLPWAAGLLAIAAPIVGTVLTRRWLWTRRAWLIRPGHPPPRSGNGELVVAGAVAFLVGAAVAAVAIAALDRLLGISVSWAVLGGAGWFGLVNLIYVGHQLLGPHYPSRLPPWEGLVEGAVDDFAQGEWA